MLKIIHSTGDGNANPKFLISEIKLWSIKMGEIFPGRFYFEPAEDIYQFSWSGNNIDGELTVYTLPCSATVTGVIQGDIDSQRLVIYAACMSAVTEENPLGNILYNIKKKRKINYEVDFVFRILPQTNTTGALLRSNIDGKIYYFAEIHSSILFAMNHYAEYMEKPFHTDSTHSYGKKLVVALCAMFGGVPLPLPQDEVKLSSLCNVDFATKKPERTSINRYNPLCITALDNLATTILAVSDVSSVKPSNSLSLIHILESDGIDKALIEESKRKKTIEIFEVDTLFDIFNRIVMNSGELTVFIKPGVDQEVLLSFNKIFNVDSISIITSQD